MPNIALGRAFRVGLRTVYVDTLLWRKYTGDPRYTKIVHGVEFKKMWGLLKGPPAPEDGIRVGDKSAEVWKPQIGGLFPRAHGC